MPSIPYILPLNSTDATLRRVGGKAANLSRLSRAGFPVPTGFLITTAAYRAFVEANGLQPQILTLAGRASDEAPGVLEEISSEIQGLFAAGGVPQPIADAIVEAYQDLSAAAADGLESIPVAVRSSATAEDLPQASFAGQQDTYLNMVGQEALLDAVQRCWASLWTARAIGYRARNSIPSDEIALAVVVQQMAPATASGVLFTADPVSEDRQRTVIDATFGLGEALVSGQVEPDHYVYDERTGEVVERHLGAKARVVEPRPGGGTDTIAAEASDRQALPDPVIVRLAELGRRVEGLFGAPQDIEWTWGGDLDQPQATGRWGGLALVQSRPITSLFPLPEPAPDDFAVYFSLAAVQGMLAPFTPLGADVLRLVLANVIKSAVAPDRRRPLRRAQHAAQGVAHLQRLPLAADRIFVDITSPLSDPRAARFLLGAAGLIEPAMVPALKRLARDPRLPERTVLDFTQILYITRGLMGFLPWIAGAVRRPEVAVAEMQLWIAGYLNDVERRVASAGDLREVLEVVQGIAARGLTGLARHVLSRVVIGIGAMNLTRILTGRWIGNESRALELTRGLPNNPTTEMDFELWRLAELIRSDCASFHVFASQPAEVLQTAYRRGILPAAAQLGMARFLARYGARGVAEIDIGRPRWRDEPASLFDVLQGYLRLQDPSQSPAAIFERGSERAGRTLRELQRALRRQGLVGCLKARILGFLYRRIRVLSGLREMPKFTIVRMMGVLRERLLDEGERLVGQDVLDRPDDIFFVSLMQLEAFARGEIQGAKLQAIVSDARVAYDRELRRVRVPRVLTSDGEAFYGGIPNPAGAAGDRLVGSPVSPGVVEGRVRVVLDPHNAGLQPGEIMVCPGTDPGWTPLFLTTSGLVMEMGGMMTHGSVVAREYGIPAVVGVEDATQRLTTGQRIRVDGTAGVIELLE